jgi:hypothetical protein
VTPRISSEDVDGRRSGCGAEAVKSNELTPTGTGPTGRRSIGQLCGQRDYEGTPRGEMYLPMHESSS